HQEPPSYGAASPASPILSKALASPKHHHPRHMGNCKNNRAVTLNRRNKDKRDLIGVGRRGLCPRRCATPPRYFQGVRGYRRSRLPRTPAKYLLGGLESGAAQGDHAQRAPHIARRTSRYGNRADPGALLSRCLPLMMRNPSFAEPVDFVRRQGQRRKLSEAAIASPIEALKHPFWRGRPPSLGTVFHEQGIFP
ncbi:hypothetical protein SAMN04489859_10551, partial [Paracoccus alcaliphilus]